MWKGSFYRRGGRTTDKHGNVYHSKPTWRQRGSGYVITEQGTFLGVEKPRQHKYGRDEKKARKPATFVRPNRIGSLKPRGAHTRRLV